MMLNVFKGNKNYAVVLLIEYFHTECVFHVLLLDLVTGAVGLPLPGMEVRIVMNNTANTTIVESNHRETQVIHT